MSALSDVQREVLTAVCDTVVPSLDQEGDPDGFFARSASDVGAPAALERMLAGMPPEQQAGLMQLLDALADQGFIAASRRSREQILRNVSLMGPAAAAGVGALSGLTLFLSYALPDGRGQNPFWSRFGYPGPMGAPPDAPQERSRRCRPTATPSSRPTCDRRLRRRRGRDRGHARGMPV